MRNPRDASIPSASMKHPCSRNSLFAVILAGAAFAAESQEPPAIGHLRHCAVVSAGAGDSFAEEGVNRIQAMVDRQIFDGLVTDLHQNGYAVKPVFIDSGDKTGTSKVVDAMTHTLCAGLIQVAHHMGEDEQGRYFAFDVEAMHAAPTGQQVAGKDTQATLIGDFKKHYRFPRTEDGMNAFHTGTFANTVFADLAESHAIDAWYDPDPDATVVRNEYDRIVARFKGNEMHVRHILVPDEAQARAAIARIQHGEQFGVVARELTIDMASRDNGGDLDWAKLAAYPPEFARAVEAFVPKGFDPDPVRSQFGWHVIEVLETRPARLPAFDDVKVKVAAQMKLAHDKALPGTAR